MYLLLDLMSFKPSFMRIRKQRLHHGALKDLKVVRLTIGDLNVCNTQEVSNLQDEGSHQQAKVFF